MKNFFKYVPFYILLLYIYLYIKTKDPLLFDSIDDINNFLNDNPNPDRNNNLSRVSSGPEIPPVSLTFKNKMKRSFH
jgi:hypothetical protein